MKSTFRWLWFLLINLILLACYTIKMAEATYPLVVSSTGRPPSNAETGVALAGIGYFEHAAPLDAMSDSLDWVPNAVPQDEVLIKSANLPYSEQGINFRPDTRASSYQVVGKASWYGKQFHGRKTSSGEMYDMYAMTAAHQTLPIPSYARVTNLNNGRSVVVRINDRGPFHGKRVMDLSYAAAHKLGFIKQGSTRVEIEQVWMASDGSLSTIKPPESQEGHQPKYIQLAAFSKLSKAEALMEKLLDKLDNIQYESKLGIVNQGGVYKVRIGPFQSSAALQRAISTLQVSHSHTEGI